MNKLVQKQSKGLHGEITIPSDKSISHRAVIFSTLVRGKSVIKNFSFAKDPMSSKSVCEMLGADIQVENNSLTVNSTGKLSAPYSPLFCGNSGTTMRLMAGVLAGQNFKSILTGDTSLSNRPMKRIIEPLSLMGADISSDDYKSPLTISGKNLHAIEYTSPIASAQVKSCILLAGLNAEGVTKFKEPYLSRNHTELMLKSMGADVRLEDDFICISKSELTPLNIEICGDISSAAYFIVAGLLIPNSKIILKNIGLNPTRSGILEVAQKMGANIKILDKRNIAGEDIGDIEVNYTENFEGIEISGDIIPRLIDELPVIAVLATQAQGDTMVKDAQDLRNKESDRISTIVNELKKIGADIEELPDGFVVHGGKKLQGGCEVESYSDHRLAMSLYVAGLISEKSISINGFEWVDISFPEFEKLFISISN